MGIGVPGESASQRQHTDLTYVLGLEFHRHLRDGQGRVESLVGRWRQVAMDLEEKECPGSRG